MYFEAIDAIGLSTSYLSQRDSKRSTFLITPILGTWTKLYNIGGVLNAFCWQQGEYHLPNFVSLLPQPTRDSMSSGSMETIHLIFFDSIRYKKSQTRTRWTLGGRKVGAFSFSHLLGAILTTNVRRLLLVSDKPGVTWFGHMFGCHPHWWGNCLHFTSQETGRFSSLGKALSWVGSDHWSLHWTWKKGLFPGKRQNTP